MGCFDFHLRIREVNSEIYTSWLDLRVMIQLPGCSKKKHPVIVLKLKVRFSKTTVIIVIRPTFSKSSA